jgi:3-hydroxyisobutyrate dehydrogenase
LPTRVIVFQLGEVDDEDMRVENPKLAVLGLGTMGSAIARTALRSEIPLAVWNRGVEATEPFGIAGADVAPSVADATAAADVVVTMVT